MTTPTKEQVREWTERRKTERTPPPSPEQVKRELGWDMITERRKSKRPDGIDAAIGMTVLILFWPMLLGCEPPPPEHPAIVAPIQVKVEKQAVPPPAVAPAPMRSTSYNAHADAYRAMITREAQFRFGIPAPVPAIAGQIQQESAWNPAARSRVGAAGLMQFMPQTATWAATAGAFGSVDPYNPVWSIRAGIWYDRWLYERVRTFDSDCDRWLFALSSYNGGLGYAYKRQKLSLNPGDYTITGKINPGITAGNQHENETYGPKIMQRHQPAFRSWGKVVCIP